MKQQIIDKLSEELIRWTEEKYGNSDEPKAYAFKAYNSIMKNCFKKYSPFSRNLYNYNTKFF